MAGENSSLPTYPLLSFHFNKGLYKKQLTLERHPKFMERIVGSAEQYMHDDFGLCTNDDTNVLAHAVYVLKELEKKDEPHEIWTFHRRDHLKESLCTDLIHYCTCVKYGCGDKVDLAALMEAALFYGGDKVVYDEVMEWNKDSGTGEPSPLETIFNFDALYIKMGDYLLFLRNDLSAALKFYSLAALTWNVEMPSPYRRKENYFIDFGHQYELLAELSREKNYFSAHPDDKLPFSALYNDLLMPDECKEKDIYLAGFMDAMQKELDDAFQENMFRKRAAFIMAVVIIQKYLVEELARLADDADRARWEKDVIAKSQLLRGTLFDSLARFAWKMKNHQSMPTYSYEDYLLLVKEAHLVSLILQELDAEQNCGYIAYYTSTEVFSYMLPEKCTGSKKERLGKLTVMHLSYMNDPNEGQTLRKALYGPEFGSDRSGRKALNVPYVFVKCFSPRIDYLPMWEMYGDHARGCCLTIDWNASKMHVDEDEPTLYRVCYLHKMYDGTYAIQRVDNQELGADTCTRIQKQLYQLAKISESLSGTAQEHFDELLGKALYLFKDSSYSYEQELRVIYQTKEGILHTEPKREGDKPWLFVQTPFPLQLNEVILGPKFPDVSTQVPYLQQQLDEMCEKTSTRMPRITLSEIDYR